MLTRGDGSIANYSLPFQKKPGRKRSIPLDREQMMLAGRVAFGYGGVTGMYFMTKEVLKVMRDDSDGRIINVSSVLGKFGVPGYSAYCTTKHGMIGFTRALALEVVNRGITVNAICPGWVETEMAHSGMRESASYQGITVEEFKRQAI